MTRLAVISILLTVAFYSCSDKTLTVNQPSTFKSFEISYTDGWTKTFSFFVDANKIYFSPQRWDTTYYGILPDSLFKMLDTTFSNIRNDRTVKSKDGGCVDCSVLAVKIIADSDTIRINQTGDLDGIFYPMVKSLQKFIDSSNHQAIRAVVWMDTQSIVTPPPPKVDETKFKPPK